MASYGGTDNVSTTQTTPGENDTLKATTSNNTQSSSGKSSNQQQAGGSTNNNNHTQYVSDTSVSHEILEPNEASRAVRFVKWYIGCLFYLRYPLLLTWTLIILGCAVAAGDLTKNLSDEVAPPEDSPAKIAL